jgi:hypothetical protein
MQELLAQGVETGPVPSTCAAAAASLLSMSLLAMGQNRTLVPSNGQRQWMDSMELGMRAVSSLTTIHPFLMISLVAFGSYI